MVSRLDVGMNRLEELGVVRLEPVAHLLAQALGQRDHFIGFGLMLNEPLGP